MLKGQLFRVAWPGNSWTVHFPSSATTIPTHCSYVASHTQGAHHYTEYAQEDFFKVPHSHIKALK